ncbi:MAG: pilin [bacterium]
MKYWKLFILTLIITVALIKAGTVLAADCEWSTNANCSDKGSAWADATDGDCTGTKPSGSTAKCCCVMGCCQWYVSTITALRGAIIMESGVQEMKPEECKTKEDDLNKKYVNSMSASSVNVNFFKGYAVVGDGCEKKKVVTPPTPPGPNTPKKGTAAWDIDPLTNPIKTINASVVIGRVVRALLLIIGSIALLMFIYGGFMWMTAAGNDTKITKAKHTLVWATLGLIVIYAAYVLVKYVMEAVGAI